MLNAFRTVASNARAGILCSAAAILLSACGGSTELGNGPAMLNENLPSSIDVSAAPADGAAAQEAVFDWRTANGGNEAPSASAQQMPATAPVEQGADPAASADPASAPVDASAAVTPGQPDPLPAA